jgi:hypothetical protein
MASFVNSTHTNKVKKKRNSKEEREREKEKIRGIYKAPNQHPINLVFQSNRAGKKTGKTKW